jgi:hypothetical protein
MNWLSTLDQTFFRPAAHPTMFALVVGVALGTILLPEIWRVVRDHAFPAHPRSDWDLREMFDYLRVRSKWAIGRPYYTGVHDRLLEEDICEVLFDAVAQGRLTLWGRPVPDGVDAMFGRGIEVKIAPLELRGKSLDLTTIDSTAPFGAVLRQYSQDQFRFLRVDPREIRREWPPTNRIRLLFDGTWNSRKKRITPNVAEAHEAV